MLHGYNRPVTRTVGRPIVDRDRPDRLIGGDHYLGKNPQKLPNEKPSRPDCVVCSDRKKKWHQRNVTRQCVHYRALRGGIHS